MFFVHVSHKFWSKVFNNDWHFFCKKGFDKKVSKWFSHDFFIFFKFFTNSSKKRVQICFPEWFYKKGYKMVLKTVFKHVFAVGFSKKESKNLRWFFIFFKKKNVFCKNIFWVWCQKTVTNTNQSIMNRDDDLFIDGLRQGGCESTTCVQCSRVRRWEFCTRKKHVSSSDGVGTACPSSTWCDYLTRMLSDPNLHTVHELTVVVNPNQHQVPQTSNACQPTAPSAVFSSASCPGKVTLWPLATVLLPTGLDIAHQPLQASLSLELQVAEAELECHNVHMMPELVH